MTDQELNEAVASKLGWTYEKPPEFSFDMPMWIQPNGDRAFILPDFCNSIAAAWEIVESLKARRMSILLFCGGAQTYIIETEETGTVDYCHCQINGGLANSGDCDTPARAICEAFLKIP